MKNKISKIIPYLFVLVMLVGFLGVTNKVQATSTCEIIPSNLSINSVASDGVQASITITANRPAEDKEPTNPNWVIPGAGANTALGLVTTCSESFALPDGDLNSWNSVANTVSVVNTNSTRTFPLDNNSMWLDIGESYDGTTTTGSPIKNIVKTVYLHPNVLLKDQTLTLIIPLPKPTTPKTYYIGYAIKSMSITEGTHFFPYPPSQPVSFTLPNDDSKINPNAAPRETSTGTTGDTALGVAIADLECLKAPFSINIPNCIVGIAYPVFFQLPAFILATTAKLFNAMLSLTISSKLYTQSTFIPEAWAVVRDISNIFFILILLYTAMQVILGWSHDTRKIIAQVVIMAMLINFSMFFTQVVIDSSNVLALIFFNKIAVKGANNAPIPYQPSFNSGIPEKDMGGAIASGFNPAGMMKPEMFQARTIPIPGPGNKTATIPQPGASFFLAIIFVSCVIFLYASYAFFIAAISFLGRLIELWILIIFSPFAFMSSALPALDHIEGFGWKKWLDKLLTVAFMAPVFMFFMYVITKIIAKMDIFTGMQNTTSSSAASDLLIIIIPAIICITLLMKAVSYAKKGGGQFSNAIMTAGKVVGGLALGATGAGAALLATKTIGAKALSVANNDELRKKAASGDKGAQRKLTMANSLAKSSFDFRQTGAGKFVAKQTGMDFNKGTGIIGMDSEKLKGGQMAEQKRIQEKEIEKSKTYELTGGAATEQNNRAAEYNADKGKAAKNMSEEWNREYEAKRRENKYSDYPVDEKVFKENYEKTNPKPELDEKAFKQAYERGDKTTLQSFGIDKEKDAKNEAMKKAQVAQGTTFDLAKFEKEYKADPNVNIRPGSVQTAADENKDRKTAYANNLQSKADKEEARGAVRSFFAEWAKGAKQMTTTKAGLATTAATTAMTGGLGLILAPAVGGFLHALKETMGAKDIRSTSAEVITAVRKGEDPNKKLIDELKKMTASGHSDSGKLSDIAKTMTSGATGGSTPTNSHPPASH